MKMSKITSLILAGSAFALIGCGSGGGSSTSNSTPTTKITKVTASDAYVVALPDPATITLANGKSYATTKVDGNGTVVFDNLPADANLTGAKVHIPDSAIVDTDGDGKLSQGDQTIRMPLSVKYDTNHTGVVANPLTTVAVDQHNEEVLKQMNHFDPVKAKLELTKNYDEKLAKEVALNDAVANAIKNAKEKNESTQNVINSIDINNLKNVIDNPSIDVKTALQTSLNNVNDPTAVNKAVEVITLAQDVNKLVKEGKITPHEGLIAIIAVSDANVSVTTAKTALEEGNIHQIIDSLPKDEKVQIHLETKQNEMDEHEIDENHDMMDKDDHIINENHNDMDKDDHIINENHDMMDKDDHIINENHNDMDNNDHAMNENHNDMDNNDHAMNENHNDMDNNDHAMNENHNDMDNNDHAMNENHNNKEQNENNSITPPTIPNTPNTRG